MIKKRIGIIGHFEREELAADGQTVKTIMIYQQLRKKRDKIILSKTTTKDWKKRPINFFSEIVKLSIKSDEIVILPAHKGVRVILPLLLFIRTMSRFKLHYVVIGGWLPDYVNNKPILRWFLSNTDFIYVETNRMLNSLNSRYGLINCYLLRNFKNMYVGALEYKKENYKNKAINICTLSRVNEQKGITEAIRAVNLINKEGGDYRLTIFGPIAKEYKYKFKRLISESDGKIIYGGVLKRGEIATELSTKNYLLFPTKYWTEGVPGAIIDAYSVGIPVVCSRWLNFGEVVDEGITGYGYEFNNFNELCILMKKLIHNKNIYKHRKACLDKYNSFTPEESMKSLAKNLGI